MRVACRSARIKGHKLALLFMLMTILSFPVAYAHEKRAIDKTMADILDIFQKDFKEQQNIKELVLMHVNEPPYRYKASVACRDEVAHISFDDGLVYINNYNKSITAAILAHEIAHCNLGHKGIKLRLAGKNDRIEMEYEADKLGLQYFINAGYSPQDYKLMFNCLDSDGKNNHPQDKKRCDAIDTYIREGK